MFVRKKPRLDEAKPPTLPAIATDVSPKTPPRPTPVDAQSRPSTQPLRPEKMGPSPLPAPKMPVPAKRPDYSASSAGVVKYGHDQVPGRLIIGRDIELKGEITTCDELVVDGNLDASVVARHLKISSDGAVVGRFEVRSADIDGRFSGDLIVKENLSVRAGGRVEGHIRYGTIEVALGGIVKGDLDEKDGTSEALEHNAASVSSLALENAR